MKAWYLNRVTDLASARRPLELVEIERPLPGPDHLLIKVSCCGVCHTELDEIEGRTLPLNYPVIPGHQVIGNVVQMGSNVSKFKVGDRVGVAWIYSACGYCDFCTSGKENLCKEFKGTGRDANGGYAEYIVVNEKFACTIPSVFSDLDAAPLLCAGAIGYRSLQLARLHDGQVLGLSGFGASAHLVLKTAKYILPNSQVLVFARSEEEQKFALALGATWAGGINDNPPMLAHGIIDTTPAWLPVISSLAHLQPGGRLVINAIRKEEIDKGELLTLDYQQHLWMEKEIKSVANITIKDVERFLALAAQMPIRPDIQTYSFDQANEALLDLKRKHTRGAKVLLI
jgi:alcohol dehydrogenase, propanol-preferring